MYELIDKKKNGEKLTRDEIYYIVDGYTNGKIPDYQMSAFLMAVCFQGMNDEEIYHFTMAMTESGETIDLSSVNGKVIDKHSTGGVGDKVSLILGPLVAACGVPVAKMSGRGLGHTGGTIDKLECFDGFDVSPSEDEFMRNVNTIGISWAGQTSKLAPADKKIYALRDVTATVDCIPLIASSVMSKKLASGAAGIVLDVTYGSGAFMKDTDSAMELARVMVDIGKKNGKEMAAVITNMDEPLGYAVGNNLEVIEAIECLRNKGPEDVMAVTYALGSHMLVMNGRCSDMEEAKILLKEKITDGSAYRKMKEWISTQGGNADLVDNPELFEKAPYVFDVIYEGAKGYVEAIDGKKIGLAVQRLGGGRTSKDDIIDKTVGVVLCKKVGNSLENGDILARIYSKNEEMASRAKKMLLDAYNTGNNKVVPKAPVYAEI